MTRRAIALGLGLGLAISFATYFNNWIIAQTHLIGNFFPVSVFGVAALLLLAINPALRALSARAPLAAAEVAVVAAIALAACGWPASNFYRYLTPMTALPAHWLKTTPSWQATHVMSYIPGASAELGDGHVQDLTSLAAQLTSVTQGNPASPAGALWRALSPEGRRLFKDAARTPHVNIDQAQALVRSLNGALAKRELYDPAAFSGLELSPPLRELVARAELAPHEVVLRNRLLLSAAFPREIMPPPAGSGALVAGGRADALVVDTLLQGRSPSNPLSLAELPWRQWWPTLRLWCGTAFLLGLCALCLSLVVHPQWSRRELLPYPIVRFLGDLGERTGIGRLPDIARSKLFWVSFLLVFTWHLVNGLHAWFPEVPEIPRRFDFWRLQQLFPNAARVSGTYGWFNPTLYLSVVAFCFYMPTSVSFGLGVSHLLFFVFGSALIVNGIQLSTTTSGATPTSLMRFGSYLGATLIIAYTGRQYFKSLALSAFGGRRTEATPKEAVWALRGLLLCGALTVVCLRSSGLGWLFSCVFVLVCLMTFLVVTRIVAETGNFFVQVEYSIAALLVGMLGFEAVGPSAFILMAIATDVLIPDLREALMPYIAHGLKLAEGIAKAPPQRLLRWLLVMLSLGFVLAGVVTLYLQYNHSVMQVGDEWATHRKPRIAFDTFARLLAEARSQGTLVEATGHGADLAWGAISPTKGALGWLALGLLLVLGVSIARLNFQWWPLHPVAFLVWDTYASIMFGPSFLIGWMLKASVLSLGGARAHHAVKPAVVGVITAELLSALFWVGIGIAYYFITGRRPQSYAIFPL